MPPDRHFEHHTGDSVTWLDSTPILWKNILGVIRGLPPLFPFHQPHEKTCEVDGYLEYPNAAKALHL
ncbi:hypothetical protein TNCV_427881 [Trichonephila clavipes]|nr:hypothetical protein TNCV_427881 [Trichonephila clavipes]